MDGDARRSQLQDRPPPPDLHRAHHDRIRADRKTLTAPESESARVRVAPVCWVDGKIVPADRAVIRATDSAFADGRGCFSTIRIDRGRARFVARHVGRLLAGVRDLRLGEISADTLQEGIDTLATAAFGEGDGIVRLQLSRDPSGLRAIGVPRPLAPDRAVWTAILASIPHDGVSHARGLKVTNRLTLALAREQAVAAGVDETVLADTHGRLVEGARSNLFVGLEDGSLATPSIDSGSVAGIARAVCLERVPEAAERAILLADLRSARELIAVNAVRGARPIVELDGKPVWDRQPGPWSRRLADVVADD